MESNSNVSNTRLDENRKDISLNEERIISISQNVLNEKLKSMSFTEVLIISQLHDGGPLTRDQLVKKLEIPRTTIFDALKKLIARNEVTKCPFYETERVRGRPRVLFSVLDRKK